MGWSWSREGRNDLERCMILTASSSKTLDLIHTYAVLMESRCHQQFYFLLDIIFKIKTDNLSGICFVPFILKSLNNGHSHFINVKLRIEKNSSKYSNISI